MKRLIKNIALLWLALLVLACKASADDSGKSVVVNAGTGDRALLIGIKHYQSPAINPLQGPENDVKVFRATLRSQLNFKDGEIKELKDAEATREGILSAIDQWLIQGSAPGSRVVLYYSGHGDQIDDISGDEQDGKDEALIAYDAQRDGKNWVLDDDIDARLKQLQDRKVLAVFDSCHSGTVTRGAFDDEGAKTPGWDLERVAARGGAFDKVHQKEGGFIQGGGNISAFFAVAPNQRAYEDIHDREHPHGVFTAAFAVGVGGAADADHDKKVSYAELLDFLQIQSNRFCETNQNKCVDGVTPILEIEKDRLASNVREFGQAETSPPPPLTQTATTLLTHGNDANLALTIEPGNHVRLGEAVHYKLGTGRPGKLVIFDIAVDGKVTQLFPNNYIPEKSSTPCKKITEASEWVEQGATVRIPDDCMGFTLEAEEPIGKGKLVALLIEDPSIDTHDLVSITRGLHRVNGAPDLEKSTFEEIEKPKIWMEQLRERLDQPIHEADGRNRAVRWSVATVDYEIVR